MKTLLAIYWWPRPWKLGWLPIKPDHTMRQLHIGRLVIAFPRRQHGTRS